MISLGLRPRAILLLVSWRGMGNSSRWAVWLGRYTSGKVSEVPKGFLIPVRITYRYICNVIMRTEYRKKSARAKESLIGPLTARGPNAKARPSDPQCSFNWEPVLTEKLPRGFSAWIISLQNPKMESWRARVHKPFSAILPKKRLRKNFP